MDPGKLKRKKKTNLGILKSEKYFSVGKFNSKCVCYCNEKAVHNISTATLTDIGKRARGAISHYSLQFQNIIPGLKHWQDGKADCVTLLHGTVLSVKICTKLAMGKSISSLILSVCGRVCHGAWGHTWGCRHETKRERQVRQTQCIWESQRTMSSTAYKLKCQFQTVNASLWHRVYPPEGKQCRISQSTTGCIISSKGVRAGCAASGKVYHLRLSICILVCAKWPPFKSS